MSTAPPARGLIPPQSAMLFSLGMLCILLAFQISEGLTEQLEVPITSLWARVVPNDARYINIGIENQEGKLMTYYLVIETGNNILYRKQVVLDHQKTYSMDFPFQGIRQQPVQVLLFLPGAPDQPYRQVRIDATDGANQAPKR